MRKHFKEFTKEAFLYILFLLCPGSDIQTYVRIILVTFPTQTDTVQFPVSFPSQKCPLYFRVRFPSQDGHTRITPILLEKSTPGRIETPGTRPKSCPPLVHILRRRCSGPPGHPGNPPASSTEAAGFHSALMTTPNQETSESCPVD